MAVAGAPASSSFLAQIWEVTFLQELLILVTFTLSFTLWRRFKAGRFSAPKPKAGIAAMPQAFKAKDQAFTAEEKDSAKAYDCEMQQLLATGEFTRALNLYRKCERSGIEALLSEELYKSLVQSSIRVSKLDVVERILRSMKRAQLKPSVQFWQGIMKMLSSRKHFAQCLVAFGIFEHQIPVDKVVFSCLINAALECKQTKRIPEMLQRYSQADILGKDHILHFRCYVALGQPKKAIQLFQRLAPEVTNLMLNLSLHACVDQKDPEAAYALLQEAKVLEKQHQLKEKLVDVVSYNLVMKGFGAAKSQFRCFDCMKDLIEHGLQPNEISLASLMVACVATKDHQLASEIGDYMLANPSKESKPGLCKAFLSGLIRACHVSKALTIYEVMRQQHVDIADIAVFSMLIKGLVDQRQGAKALELVEDLKANSGLQLDDMLLTHVLEACRHERDYERGKKFFREAVDSGLVPSCIALVTWLKLLGCCGTPDEAFDVVRNWTTQYPERRPSVVHYTCLMKGCFRSKNYYLAWESWQLMLHNGIQPDETTISTMMSGMVQGQQWDKVMTLAANASSATLRTAMTCAPPEYLAQLQALKKAELPS